MSQSGGTTTTKKRPPHFFFVVFYIRERQISLRIILYFIVYFVFNPPVETYPVKSYSLADGKRLPNLRPCFRVVFGKEEEEETHIVKPYVHHQVHSM